jgi:hypothetical protein
VPEAPSAAVPIAPGAPFLLLGRFWTTLRDIILRPSKFYSEQAAGLVSDGGLSSALAFAVIVQWLASFFNFLWSSTAGVVMQSRVNDLFYIAGDVMHADPRIAESLDHLRQRAVDFLFGAGAIILTPFTAILKLSIVALFVHAAVRFFMKEHTDRPHRYSTTLKILAYANGPWILCVIPGLGVLAAWILAFFASVAGLREVYRTTNGRALLAILFPELLFMAVVATMIAVFLFLAFNVLRLVF